MPSHAHFIWLRGCHVLDDKSSHQALAEEPFHGMWLPQFGTDEVVAERRNRELSTHGQIVCQDGLLAQWGIIVALQTKRAQAKFYNVGQAD